MTILWLNSSKQPSVDQILSFKCPTICWEIPWHYRCEHLCIVIPRVVGHYLLSPGLVRIDVVGYQIIPARKPITTDMELHDDTNIIINHFNHSGVEKGYFTKLWYIYFIFMKLGPKPLLLIPWLLILPSYQQPWHWLCNEMFLRLLQ